MPIIWIAWFMGIPIKKREIMMAVSRPPMTTCVIICEATRSVMRFGVARRMLAENTKIDP